MSTAENERAQREALSARPSISADRARLWAGMNRYLRAEAEELRRQKRKDVVDQRHEEGAADGESAPGKARR